MCVVEAFGGDLPDVFAALPVPPHQPGPCEGDALRKPPVEHGGVVDGLELLAPMLTP